MEMERATALSATDGLLREEIMFSMAFSWEVGSRRLSIDC